MTNQQYDRVLALAGLFQSARLAQQLAHEGKADTDAVYTSLQSIFFIDADNSVDIYGGQSALPTGLKTGLSTLFDKCSGKPGPNDLELAKYVISLIQLQSKLRKQAAMVVAIADGVASIKSQLTLFKSEDGHSYHPTIVAKLAELYKQTISTLAPQILVNGEHMLLTNAVIADKIRAVLLAGIRSAVLWNQLGGRRWHLLFQRKPIANLATTILQQAGQH